MRLKSFGLLDEEGKTMYSPKIKEEFIPQLYEISKIKKMPMSKLVNRIIREYLDKNRKDNYHGK